MPPKKKKELIRFRSRLHERRRQNRFAAKDWASKLAESDKSSFYHQEEWLKDDRPIETTAKSSFASLLASGVSFLGREAAKRETKS